MCRKYRMPISGRDRGVSLMLLSILTQSTATFPRMAASYSLTNKKNVSSGERVVFEELLRASKIANVFLK